jgi:hypothetical protein
MASKTLASPMSHPRLRISGYLAYGQDTSSSGVGGLTGRGDRSAVAGTEIRTATQSVAPNVMGGILCAHGRSVVSRVVRWRAVFGIVQMYAREDKHPSTAVMGLISTRNYCHTQDSHATYRRQVFFRGIGRHKW